MLPTVFLSHNHADKPFVRRLAADLDNQGIPYWLDEAEIKVGESLIEKIRSTGKNGPKRNVYGPLDGMVVGGAKTEGVSNHLECWWTA